MTDIEDDLPKGPNGLRNYTKKELFESAKIKYWNVWNCDDISKSDRPTFLIRLHNLTFKRVAGKYPEDRFKRQDLTINIGRKDKITLGQRCNNVSFDIEEDDEQEYKVDLMGDCFSPFVAETHCKISRFADEDKVWIKDLDTQQGTFLNGRKLTPNIYNGLENGDIVSLGISHLDTKVRISEGQFWVFKFMEVSNEEENHRKYLVSQTFGNSVILSNILGHNETNKIFEWRQVSKIWNQIALPILRKKSTMFLCIGLKQELHDNIIEKSKTTCIYEFKQKTEIFKFLGLQQLYIRELFHDNFQEITDITVDGLKLLENFFILCKNQILKVSLAFNCEISERKHEIKIQMIQALFKECENLQEIEINFMDLSKILEVGTVTSAIKRIAICYQQSNMGKFLKLFPNIVELTIQGIPILQNFVLFATKKKNEKFVKQSLSCLKVLKIIPVYLECLDAEVVKSLGKIPLNIEELKINGLRLNPNFPTELSNAISGFGKSLRKLNLGVIRLSTEEMEGEFLFPKMERLERLHIYVAYDGLRHRWKFAFESEKCGPNLEVLKIEDQIPDQFHGVRPAEMLMRIFLNEGGKKQFPKLKYAIVKEEGVTGENYAHLLNDNVA